MHFQRQSHPSEPAYYRAWRILCLSSAKCKYCVELITLSRIRMRWKTVIMLPERKCISRDFQQCNLPKKMEVFCILHKII